MSIVWKSEKRCLRDLKDYENNPRKMDKARFEKLVESLKSDGYHQRLIVNQDGTIIGGHARKKALLKSGYKESSEIEVLIPDRLLVGEDFDRINIRDNLPYGEFDFEILGNNFEAAQLIEWGMPEDWLQVAEEEIVTEESDNEAPDILEDPITKLGDIWKLGEHRLMCGDSTSVTDIESLLENNKVHCTFTSPPYNGNTHLDYGKKGNHSLYKNDKDNKTSEDYVSFLQDCLSSAIQFTDGFVFWNISYNANSRFEFLKSIYLFSDKLWETIIWKKTGMPLSSGLTRNCEFIFCFKSGERVRHLGNKNETNFMLWDICNTKSQDIGNHHACFPIELPLKGIQLATDKKESILDLFGGTGSTLIACEKSKRKCYMMELSPNYCDVIIARWEKLTNNKAELLA